VRTRRGATDVPALHARQSAASGLRPARVLARSGVRAFHQVARYVDKILKGAKAADLPIEQPTRFKMMIKPKAAKALGVTIPSALLLQAAQVIE
jgi:putative ABC transport system substrate-binding protein